MVLDTIFKPVLEEMVLDRARFFAETQIVLLSEMINRPITQVLNEDFDSLSAQEKYAKALLLLSDYSYDKNKTKLEEATVILDHLSANAEDNQSVYTALAFTQGLDHRYLEADLALRKVRPNFRDAEEKEPRLGCTYHLETLIAEGKEELTRKKGGLHFKPKESYVLLYEDNAADVEKLLGDFEDSEVVLVVDNINHLQAIKERFADSLYTIENESKVYETFSPSTSSKLRVILKNSNNGISEKGQEFGKAQANQRDRTKIYVVERSDDPDLEEITFHEERALADESTRIIEPAEKIRLAFVCTTKENTHGVPVVMNNIAEQLRLDPRYEVSYITSNFDDQEISYTNAKGREYKFANRKELVRFIQKKGIKIDILHTHTWHLSDHFKPFHTERDGLDLENFLVGLGSPRLIYTDHSNPTEDLRKIKGMHGIDYAALDPKDKVAFLWDHTLGKYSPKDWEKGWEATSILSRWQLMEFAEAVTFVSATQMKEEDELIIPRNGYHDKTKVIFNGVDMGKYRTPKIDGLVRSLHQELGVNGNERVILYAGRLDKEICIYDLAEAAERLQAQTGENITVIYQSGSNPNDEATIRARERILSLSPHVKSLFPGSIGKDQREKMAAMYAFAEVVAQPTYGECFNQIAAEALAMGTPVVVSDFSAPGEIYVDSGAAFGCRVQDPEDLADKLYTALFDRERTKKTLAVGERLIAERLNVEAMGREYNNLYQELVRN